MTGRVRVVVLGRPGAGKTTVGRRLASEYRVEYVSVARVLSENIDAETPHGTPREYVERGELVPDEIMASFFPDRLPDSFVLDGFPRTLAQKSMLSDLESVVAIHVDVSADVATRRMTNRLVCRQCAVPFGLHQVDGADPRCPDCGQQLDRRTDHDDEVARQRQREYETETRPVVEAYEEDGALVTVDGEQSPDAVLEACSDAIEARP